jgi:hypothetical protein
MVSLKIAFNGYTIQAKTGAYNVLKSKKAILHMRTASLKKIIKVI